MERQQMLGENRTKYLVSSVEQGINMILSNARIALLGGRETLFFNMKRRGEIAFACAPPRRVKIGLFSFVAGIDNFQLSEKLYTRYSAVAVQRGCPHAESFNDV